MGGLFSGSDLSFGESPVYKSSGGKQNLSPVSNVGRLHLRLPDFLSNSGYEAALRHTAKHWIQLGQSELGRLGPHRMSSALELLGPPSCGHCTHGNDETLYRKRYSQSSRLGLIAIQTIADAVFSASTQTILVTTKPATFFVPRLSHAPPSQDLLCWESSQARVAASVFAYAVFRITMFPTQGAKMIDESLGEVLTTPLVSAGFTCTYGARVLRLLVMYNRHLRGHWVKVLDERVVVKGLVAAFLGIEGIAWSAILSIRIKQVGDTSRWKWVGDSHFSP